MARTIVWYFVGVICVMGLLGLLTLFTFLMLLFFQDSLTWDWFTPSLVTYLRT